MIAKSWLSSCWQGKIGAIVAVAGTLFVQESSVVLAQIVPDNTLGSESSVVTPNVNIKGIQSDRINNGAIRGANLFHSFEEFNVGTGRGAYFTNPAGIENIFSRVTGANRSEILGRLGVLGNANLFLINPRGIVFGSGASLDVQGSFLATTADAVKLGDAGLFSASQPAVSNLLTVSPSAILFNTIAAQPIVNRSRDRGSIRQPNSAGLFPGLQVQPGRTLALIGGNVLIDGGRLTATGGRIELGSVAGVGEVSVTESGDRFVLGYDFINDFGNISLSNRAFVDASGEGGGDIQIQGARLEMRQASNIWADTLGVENGGEVLIRTAEIVLSSNSLLTADVYGTGIGGDLTIETGRLLISGGAEITANARGEGKGGSLQIVADSVEVIGTSFDNETFSSLNVDSYGSGDAGNLTIETGRLLISGGAEISADTLEEGKGGSLQIVADSVEVIGTSFDNETFSSLTADSYGSGDAGNLTIDTGRLLISGGAEIAADTLEEGKGGSLQITASDSVEVMGESADGIVSTLTAQSEGRGDAGALTIDTRRLLVRDGAFVSVSTIGEGKGGSLQIVADNSVEVIGESADGGRSALAAQSEGRGDAGALTIDTRRLLVRGGAVVSTGTLGQGKGGGLQITASDSVEVIGTLTNSQLPSGLTAESQGSGDAGALTIDTRRLLVRDGAQVVTNTRGGGNGGSLRITADDSVEVIGSSTNNSQLVSGLITQSLGNSGQAGDVTIDTRRLLVRDGAEVTVGTFAEGKGGDLQIKASESVEVIGPTADVQYTSALSTQSASTASGNAGDLRIDTARLLVRDGAQVSAGTLGQGQGGSLQINASELVELIGTTANGQAPSGLFTQSGSALNRRIASGNAGDLKIDTRRLLVRDGAAVSSASLGDGTAGNINITARDTLQADNGTISTNTSRSTGGAIAIKAGDIRLNGDSDIISNVASGADNGGAITLTANSILAFDDSDILAFARDGEGGDIALNTPAFFGESYRPAPRNTDPDTLDENNQVDINATGAVSGIITIPDVSFIQNSLTELPENQINTDNLLASSCITRRNQQTRGSFTITGTGGLPQRPGDAQISSFPTVDVATLPSDGISTTKPNRSWQKGDPIVEPLGVYRLANGKLVLSRECS